MSGRRDGSSVAGQPPFIRHGGSGDLEVVLELWHAAGSVPTATDTVEALGELLRHDPLALLVAELDGAIVGSLIVAWDGWRGSFYRLAVRPDQRRRGFGSRLVAAGEEQLLQRGAVRVNVIATTDPLPVGFWEAAGYARQPGQLRLIRDFPPR